MGDGSCNMTRSRAKRGRAVRARAGQTASLVSKYRPPQPIMTLVVPQLKNDGFKWHLEGRDTARRCLIQRGLLPVLAAPSPSGAPRGRARGPALRSRPPRPRHAAAAAPSPACNACVSRRRLLEAECLEHHAASPMRSVACRCGWPLARPPARAAAC